MDVGVFKSIMDSKRLVDDYYKIVLNQGSLMNLASPHKKSRNVGLESYFPKLSEDVEPKLESRIALHRENLEKIQEKIQEKMEEWDEHQRVIEVKMSVIREKCKSLVTSETCDSPSVSSSVSLKKPQEWELKLSDSDDPASENLLRVVKCAMDLVNSEIDGVKVCRIDKELNRVSNEVVSSLQNVCQSFS